ncbi:hypothetical protein BKA65DRAFT_586487 [Rhexocercosporidium sp. MPI-PUGE-AT-0058]|nr:hypothetical protein BKA65DRAFT_586487 [Rhexocercosporidium sp. MPI-PUGE-AT-0058]
MASKPIVLILGAGPRVGASLTTKFSTLNYNIALASRSGTNTLNASGYLSLRADFKDPSSIAPLFVAVKKEFHAYPSVVIYNAGTLTPPPDKESLLSVPVDSVVGDLAVNTVSPYVAAQQAVLGWETLPKEMEKRFIFTGNITNVQIVPMPLFLTAGIGKAASAFWVGLADAMYKSKGYRFFYADERTEEGKLKGFALDGDAHGEFYAQLAKPEDGAEIPWNATFVKGKGYVKFE